MMRRKTNVRIRRRSGAAAVEAALTLPFMILFVLAIIDIGWRVNCLQMLHNAARQGARSAVYLGNSNAEVIAEARESVNTTMGIDMADVDVRITCLSAEGQELYQIMSLDENEQGRPVCVTVSVHSSNLGSLLELLGLQSRTMSACAVMVRQT